MVRFPEAQSDAATQGKAELRILDFKTTWSEFQKPSQTATEQGEAQLCIFDFKTVETTSKTSCSYHFALINLEESKRLLHFRA